MRHSLLLLLVCVAGLPAAPPAWLDTVAPIITPAEKKTWQSLKPEDRSGFERDFWITRSITPEEYYRRLAYVDGHWGTDKQGSGANTDPGRVYLALGPPTKITRVPSSRIFVPVEIWYYDSVPDFLNTELRLMFYLKGSLGLPKLYSPTVDTIRALLLPQAGTVHMFGPNDSLTESDIRKNLKTGPAEDEVITAAVGVATGIKYSGNDEILGQVLSPQKMLAKSLRTRVTARLIASQPKLDFLMTASPWGGSQVDLRLGATAQKEIDIEVQSGTTTLYRNQLQLRFPESKEIEYTHRLDLLPGQYRVVFTVDGTNFGYPLDVARVDIAPAMGSIFRADLDSDSDRSRAPLSFDGRRVRLNPEGKSAVLPVAKPGKVTWMIRKGAAVVWRNSAEAATLATVDLPTNLPPGAYRLEAVTAEDSRGIDLQLGGTAPDPKSTLISFNANLAPAQRLSFLGHQWLLRGRLTEARRSLEASLREGSTTETQVELARLDLAGGSLDAARDRLRGVLARNPENFEALAVYGTIEAQLQDYAVAAEYYRKALAVQDSPALRAALAQLPAR